MDDLESVIEQLKQELGEDKITTASDPKIKRPEKALERDMYKDFMDRNPLAGGGMLVQPGFGGTRQGYASDYSPEERKQQRIYKVKDGKKTLDLTKEQKKWFNKTHKNNPNSRFYKKDWDDLGGKKADLLDSYFNELKREKPPKGYITTKEFSKKYGFPIYEKRQYGPVTKAESNFINNALMKKITAKDADRGRKNLFLKKFLIDNLEPKQFTVLKDLGDGKKSAGKVNYVKDNAALAKKVRTYIDSPSIDPKTIENINLVLGNNKIKSLFNKGDYKGLVKALGEVENLTNSERANVMLRVSQAMSGVNFRDFNHNIKANKVSAKKIFKGLETGRAGIPNEYNDAYKRLKHNTIKDAIGEDYFTKSYQGFIDDSRAALKKAGIDITNMDLNEITGLSSGYKNQTFSSTQFVNFMDRTFNQGAHASMIGEYSRYETALQTALKNGTVDFKGETFTPRQLINNWQQWRSGWYDRLDPKYKTKAVRDILPTFTLGKDPYASVISKKRLAELAGLNLNIREEGIRAGYAKTFPTIGSQAVLKEAVNVKEGTPKQIAANLRKLGFKCKFAASSGGVGSCDDPMSYVDDIKKQENLLKVQKINSPSAVRTLNTARKLNAARSLFTSTLGPGALAFEAVAALPIAYMGYKGGKTPENIIADATFNLIGKSDKRVFLDKAVEMGFDTANIKRAQDLLKKQEAFEKQDARADEFMGPDDLFMYPQMVQKAERDLLDVTKQFIDPKTGQVIPERVAAFDQLPLVEQGVAKDQADLATKRQEQVGGFLQSPVADYLPNFAGGGIAGLSGGIDKGPQIRSMNPDSQGLSGLLKRGIKG
jgi:hypothetical protein